MKKAKYVTGGGGHQRRDDQESPELHAIKVITPSIATSFVGTQLIAPCIADSKTLKGAINRAPTQWTFLIQPSLELQLI
jgi:hypothetical protein